MPSALTTTLIQSTFLNVFSNLLAQVIDQHGKNKPFTLNVLALLQFMTYAIIIVPINFVWQKHLEARYPGFPRASSTQTNNASALGSTAASGSDAAAARSSIDAEDLLPRKEKPARWKPARPQLQKQSGLRNFAIKFILDQTVGSVMNIVLFVILINLLKGSGWGRAWELVCEDFRPIMIARLKYRPIVSTLLYTVVPVDRRVVFGSACGVIWGVYLSLYAAV
ncbi:hypothetical protein ASPWEDRAFT_312145 [Aspergillus wentii DTO 134E9]|uniref:Mpv17/PMP22 family protein n=1 Tax=Aspergillus wentii DTO 134E9 TaxID=1073089 RepID=A0A1L9RTN3_ASPWE|nr:uncharacterized protein ASPWEDRAFT_312145 [Aspergillus wentii DTO 134E9]KAI9933822.1 hypothetical protein MW887_004894 [Aspergillus wentii]OJJ38167.1 hypothetical protein ASPWEDRAFT_312145 [Aspergillus wentii DTO 134E9]